MDPALREKFDAVVEQVIAGLPDAVRQLLDEVPLIVEDYPSDRVMQEMGIRHPEELCGLYTGVPLTESRQYRQMPDHILIYRTGILALSRDRIGRISRSRLERQVRITVLHEIGHHHGLDEDELTALGYG